MKIKNYDELDDIIQESLKINDKPSLELNNQLKSQIYQREKVLMQKSDLKSISLWFVPMTLNFILFALLSVMSLITISNPYISRLVAGICLYISVAGILITFIGVRRTNLKEVITIHIEKRRTVA